MLACLRSAFLSQMACDDLPIRKKEGVEKPWKVIVKRCSFKLYVGDHASLQESSELLAKCHDGRKITKIGVGNEHCSRKLKAKKPLKHASYGGSIPSILHAVGTFRDLNEALKPWAESLSSKERTIILKEQGDWERAIEIFEWFKRKECYEPNVIHYNIMLRILGKSKKWVLVESLWIEMQKKGIEPTNSTYATLIDVFSKGGLRKQALVWLGDMFKKGLEPDEVTVGVVTQTYKKAGKFQSAEEFLKWWSLAREESSLALSSFNSHLFNTLIDTYGKAGQIKEASETFAKMLAAGIAPTTVTFNTMIHIYGNHGHLEEVANLYAKMKELQCLPSTTTYNILISFYAKNNNISKATEYFSEMKSRNIIPTIVSYHTLLYAYSIRHMVTEAESLVSEMEEQGLEIDESEQIAMTRMYIGIGKLEKSWACFEKYQDKMSSECFAANIDSFGFNGYLPYAEKAYLSSLTRGKLSVVVFNVMINVYGLAKRYDKVCEIANSMKAYEISPDKCTYKSVIQILSSADLPHKATLYLRQMQEAGIASDCVPYCAVLSSFTKQGDLRSAEGLYEEMVAYGIKPDIIVFGVLINAFAEIGNVFVAKRYVDLMKDAGYDANTIICNSLIKLYTKVGYLKEAREIYYYACSLDDAPNAYSSNCMIELYCDNRMVNEAEEIFGRLKQSRVANEFSYAMMLCLYKRVGRITQAFGIAQEMLSMGLLSDALSYNIIVELFALHGRLKDAMKILKQMLNYGIEPNDATFRSLGISLIKRGVSKKAINNLEWRRKKDSKSGLLAWIDTLHSMLGFDESFLKIGLR